MTEKNSCVTIRVVTQAKKTVKCSGSVHKINSTSNFKMHLLVLKKV